MTEDRHEEEWCAGYVSKTMKQLPHRVPEGLLELEIMTEDRHEEEWCAGYVSKTVKQLPLRVPEGLLELEIMTEKIGIRKNSVLGM